MYDFAFARFEYKSPYDVIYHFKAPAIELSNPVIISLLHYDIICKDIIFEDQI